MHASTLTRHELVYELHTIGTTLSHMASNVSQSAFSFLSGWVRPARVRANASSAVDEANELRTIAAGLAGSDPRFAQDLYAAADRHELAAGAH